MAEITAAAVRQLRERTDLPMMECKKALVASDGDEEQAMEWLRERSKGKLADRAGNVTAEGRIFQHVADDLSSAAMVEIQCESEPVSGSEHLVGFGELCLKQVVEGPGADTPEELLGQQAPDGSGKTLQELFDEMSGKIREKIVVQNVCKLEGPVAGYVHHNHKVGVLFQAEGDSPDEQVMRDVAMHIAALRPKCTHAEDLPEEEVKAERERLSEEARATGKPENIIEKIVDGRMKAFYVEAGVLVFQPFAKDDSKTVKQALAEKGLKAKSFKLWTIGT
ncbi:translation elongation factor Ts [Stratiformator vulcanicus]|uniref:Elongation factor Ts n=1 Tax=Stratiformator vulcanicus TaxID=2527980 RepID=A0A517QX29_9PLAN|nr:translation elongation factor Ts [Stratiformator vulcanicus]QDT36154.1 Elongation factor Ts [Stratiformator vulcanicus]